MAPDNVRRRTPSGTTGNPSKVVLLPEDIGGLARRLPPAVPDTLFILGLNRGMQVAPDAGFRVTFGRHPDDVHIQVGTGDNQVSRQHGHIERQGSEWILYNTGRRPIRFPDSRRLLKDGWRALPGGYAPLFIVCDDREHLLEVRVTTRSGPPETDPPYVEETRESRKWALTGEEHLAVLCLGQRYLESGSFPQPLTWKETADQLAGLQPEAGWDSKRVQRIITEIRARLSGKGVRGLTRKEVGEPVGNLLNHNLIMELLTTASLLPEHLELLAD